MARAARVSDTLSQYPTLFAIVGQESVSADIASIDKAYSAGGGLEEIAERLRELCRSGLQNPDLIFALVQPFPEFATAEAANLESQLVTIVQSVGINESRSAYKNKLLARTSNAFLDCRYEIAVAAAACRVLDPRTVELEKPIPDASRSPKDQKNTDVYGMFRGQAVRIEVTVIHEELPPAIDLELDEYVEQADVGGFCLTLRRALATRADAEQVRRLLEALYARHGEGAASQRIEGIRFDWRAGAYFSDQAGSPIESLQFYDTFPGAENAKQIIHPCSVRMVTPKYIREDYPNPPGVVTLAGIPEMPTREPVSKKVHDMLAGKLAQCADGTVNIVAFGNPLAMHDREIHDAVAGSTMVNIPFSTDSHGIRHMGDVFLWREQRAPFVPADQLNNDHQREDFVYPFRKRSAVWMLRLGKNRHSEFIPNPNATIPVRAALRDALSCNLG